MSKEDFPAARNPGNPAVELDMDPTNAYKGKPSPVYILRNLITLPQLSIEFKGREVYVINNSKELLSVPMRVALVIYTSDNSEVLIEVASSWLPQRLSDHATIEDLVRSTHFRTALSRRSLLLVNPDFAEAILETPTGQQEAANLAKSSHDLTGYGALMEGKDDPKLESYEPQKPVIPAEIREVENVRAELIGAVNNGNVASVVSILTMAMVSNDLKEQERTYIRARMSDRQVLELLQESMESSDQDQKL